MKNLNFTVRRVRGAESNGLCPRRLRPMVRQPNRTCANLSAHHPDPGDDVTACSQVATPSSCVQNGHIRSAFDWGTVCRSFFGPRPFDSVLQTQRTSTLCFFTFSSVNLEVIPYFSRFRVGLFPSACTGLYSSSNALRAC